MSAKQWFELVARHAAFRLSTAAPANRRRNGAPRMRSVVETLECRRLLSLTLTTTAVTPATVHDYNGAPIGPGSVTASDSDGVIDSNPADFTYTFSGTGATVYNSTTAPTKVGTYSVTATYPGDATHSSSTSQPGTIEIDKATTITVVTVIPSSDYNGNPKPYDFLQVGSRDDTKFTDSNLADYTILYTGTGSTTYSSATAPTNAGTYQVSATFNGDANHASSNDTEPFTINKANTQTQVLFVMDHDYNSSPFSPFDLRATSLDDPHFLDTNSADFTFDYTGTGTTTYSSSTAPTNAGSYQLAVSYNGDANHATSNATQAFNIGKAITQTTVGIEPDNFYTGSPIVPFSVRVASPDDTQFFDSTPADFTYSYVGTGQTTYSSSTAPTDVGSYQVSATYPGDANHLSSSDSESFNIDKVPVGSVGATDDGGVYNGNPYPATAARAVGLGFEDTNIADFTFSYVGTGTTVYAASATAPTNPGAYTVTATYVGDANHESHTGSPLPFTISKVTPTVTVSDAGGTFNANPYPATAAEAKGVNSLDDTTLADFTFSYLGTGSTIYPASSTAPTNAGTYTVTATYQGDAYNAASPSNAVPFTIQQATSSTTVTDAGGTYNGSPYAATASEAKGIGALDDTTLADFTFSYVGTGVTRYPNSSTAPTDAGTYTVTATWLGDANHIGSSNAPLPFVIGKATLSFTGNSYNVVYGQAKPTLGGTIGGAVSSDHISATYASSYTTTSPVATSPYAVVPTIVDPNHRLGNYNVSITSGNIYVTAASTSVMLASSGPSYYGQSITLTATLTTVAPGSGTPVGSVQFYSNNTALGAAVPLNAAGVASMPISTLAIGTDSITATYIPGNTNFSGSSTSISQTVGAGIVLLDKTGSGALNVSGASKLSVASSSIVVDSSSNSAVMVSGSSTVSANLTSVTGKASVAGSSSVSNLKTGQASVTDPYASLSAVTTAGLITRSSSTLNITSTPAAPLQPGLYIGGINISGNAKVTLAPGLYYFQGGGLIVGNSATLTGNGVTLYNAPTKSTDQISFTGSAQVTLSAATTGPLPGIAIFQARTATNAISISNSAVLKLTGVIYAASAAMNISGSAQLQGLGSTLALDDLLISGSSLVTI